MFDYQLLDMMELGITDVTFMDEFKGGKTALGNRPLMVFSGESWESDEELVMARCMFMDFFSGDTYADKINLSGISHVIAFTCHGNKKIEMRTYEIKLMASGVKLPRVELEEMGPHFDFTLKRSLLANKVCRHSPLFFLFLC